MTNVRITIFRQCRDLVREIEMFIKDKAKIASRVSGIKRSVLYFSKLLSVTNEEKFLSNNRTKIACALGNCVEVL